MDNENLRKKIYSEVLNSVIEKKDIIKTDSRHPKSTEKPLKQYENEILDPWIIKFYSSFESWGVKWNTKPGFAVKAEGTFEFLPIEEVMQDWDDDFGGSSWAPDMKGYHPLDMFYEMEGNVGFFIDSQDKNGLYLNKGEGEAIPLHVDFEGYLKLLAMSKGYGWWQNALVQISTGTTKANVLQFRENMPKIFPEFNWDEFVALYQSLRIDK